MNEFEHDERGLRDGYSPSAINHSFHDKGNRRDGKARAENAGDNPVRREALRNPSRRRLCVARLERFIGELQPAAGGPPEALAQVLEVGAEVWQEGPFGMRHVFIANLLHVVNRNLHEVLGDLRELLVVMHNVQNGRKVRLREVDLLREMLRLGEPVPRVQAANRQRVSNAAVGAASRVVVFPVVDTLDTASAVVAVAVTIVAVAVVVARMVRPVARIAGRLLGSRSGFFAGRTGWT